jgi:hypothetical protein
MFAARGIAVVIGAEHHASLLGPLGASFLSLDIWVAAEDADEAAELLRDLRAGGAAETPPDADADAEDTDLDAFYQQRRRAGIATALALFITFGTGHMSTGAWFRGALLAAAEAIGIRFVVDADRIGWVIIIATVAVDVIGALSRVYRDPRLPAARVHRS